MPMLQLSTSVTFVLGDILKHKNIWHLLRRTLLVHSQRSQPKLGWWRDMLSKRVSCRGQWLLFSWNASQLCKAKPGVGSVPCTKKPLTVAREQVRHCLPVLVTLLLRFSDMSLLTLWRDTIGSSQSEDGHEWRMGLHAVYPKMFSSWVDLRDRVSLVKKWGCEL